MIATKLKPPTTVTAQEFEDDPAGVKHAATEGPVVVTDGGRPAHVLMSYAEYEALNRPRKQRSALDVFREALAEPGMSAAADVEFELPQRAVESWHNPFE